MKKSLVLLSGGLDSSVNLAIARKRSEIVLAVTFDYGQKAVKRELEAASKLAGFYDVKHKIIELPFFSGFPSGALLEKHEPVPLPRDGELEDRVLALESAKKVWVPNRNGIMVNIAAALAEAENIDLLIAGFNKEEARTFPDNSENFVKAVNRLFRYSLGRKVRLVSYTIRYSKVQIVKKALRAGVPLELIWPCYLGGETICGACESCLRYLRAKKEAGVNEQ